MNKLQAYVEEYLEMHPTLKELIILGLLRNLGTINLFYSRIDSYRKINERLKNELSNDNKRNSTQSFQ